MTVNFDFVAGAVVGAGTVAVARGVCAAVADALIEFRWWISRVGL